MMKKSKLQQVKIWRLATADAHFYIRNLIYFTGIPENDGEESIYKLKLL
jgi:hypothetical protein